MASAAGGKIAQIPRLRGLLLQAAADIGHGRGCGLRLDSPSMARATLASNRYQMPVTDKQDQKARDHTRLAATAPFKAPVPGCATGSASLRQ